ncbi:DUF3618 domain-containing protein [Rothia sp. AR01]|uniref:DUF3618 domain-containing protein n=1 Tax=Rothia santali TaxID=2949643 RepID=A0A9X2KIS4_9MICC|nr:DUF3618 domain-containing protein [Rothia santali]MCP3427207.1 DUF3618 domain-containing protein [Rothia santali]
MTTPDPQNRTPEAHPAGPSRTATPKPGPADPPRAGAPTPGPTGSPQSRAPRPSPAASPRKDAPKPSAAVSSTSEPAADATPAQIEADIAETRAELGETVEQLTASLDVKAQAKHQVDAAKDRAAEQVARVQARAKEGLHTAQDSVTDEQGRLNRNGWIAAGVLGVGLCLGILLIVRAARR